MTVIINTPVSRSSDRAVETTSVGDDGHGSPSPQVGSRIDLTSNQEFLSAVLGSPRRFHYASRDKVCVVTDVAPSYLEEPFLDDGARRVATISLGIQAIHQAFAAHVPLSLTPDFLWYLIVHEVAEYVRQNPGRCASLFTETADSRQTIMVRDDSLRSGDPACWARSIGLVRDPLRARIGDYNTELFLPQFSTTTEEAATASLIALMDVVSPYYRFEWYSLCGVPQIRLEGDAADWRSLHFRADQLAREFAGLSGYFTDLLPVLQTIAETASGTTPDEVFWRSIYKHGNASGGPYVTGWITSFFAHVQTEDGAVFKGEFRGHPFDWRSDWRSSMCSGWGGYATNNFPAHVSKVAFVWDDNGTRHDMALAAGVTGVDFDDDAFLAPRLGFAVVE